MARALQVQVLEKEFNRTLQEILKKSSRSFHDVLNSQAYYYAIRAGRLTRKTPPAQIQAELGRVPAPPPPGRKRARTVWASQSLAFALVLSRLIRKSGKENLHLITDKDLEQRAIRLIKAKVRSAAFVASGWIGAIKRMRTAIPGRDRSRIKANPKDLGRQRGRPKGTAKPASFKLFGEIVATVENSATKDDPRVLQVLNKAGQNAMIETIVDMKKHLREKMKPIEQAHNAKAW